MPSILLMENAARSFVELTEPAFPRNARITLFAGPGNNGGDALAIGRHLVNAGHHVSVRMLQNPESLRGDAAAMYAILATMPVKFIDMNDPASLSSEHVVIDGLFGTGLSRPLDPSLASIVASINRHPRVIAIDLPSGLDCDTGRPLSALCVEAKITVTFVAGKVGLANPAAARYAGQVWVGQIGCPGSLVEEVAAAR